MDDMNRLGDLILKHWRTHRPELIEELEKDEPVADRLRQAQEQTGDLLYSLRWCRRWSTRRPGNWRQGMGIPSGRGPPTPLEPPHWIAIIRQADPEPDPAPVPRFPNNGC